MPTNNFYYGIPPIMDNDIERNWKVRKIYQAWTQKLQALPPSNDTRSTVHGIVHARDVINFLTIGKKRGFEQGFFELSNQVSPTKRAHDVLFKNNKDNLLTLKKEISDLLITIHREEIKLRHSFTATEQSIAWSILLLNNQPFYIIGQKLSQIMLCCLKKIFTTSFPTHSWEEMIKHGTGILCLFYFNSIIFGQYSLYSIFLSGILTFIHLFVLLNYQQLIEVGGYVDKLALSTYLPALNYLREISPLSMHPLLEQSYALGRFDAFAMLENQQFIVGFVYLAISLVFFHDYTAIAAYITSYCLSHMAKKSFCLSKDISAIFDFFLHIFIYLYFHLNKENKRVEEDTAAMKLFGYPSTKKELRQSYHDLALMYHPDRRLKSENIEYKIPMEIIHDEYERLSKKFS